MLGKLLNVFGDSNERQVKRYEWVTRAVGDLEGSVAARDDDSLAASTAAFRERIAAGESLDALLPDAFAVVREAARRAISLRHFDVQLTGGAALHDGKVAEMKTGEGKTLVATLSVYLNALEGEGVHVVTVNDYLARRDAALDGQGLLVPRTLHRLPPARVLARSWTPATAPGGELPGDAPRLPQGGLRGGHHVRHEQRVRLRLPARQHGLIARAEGAAGAALRHRRRGGQHPHRRGPHPTHHQRPVPGVDRQLYGTVARVVARACEADDPDPDYTIAEKERQVLLTDAGHHEDRIPAEESGAPSGDRQPLRLLPTTSLSRTSSRTRCGPSSSTSATRTTW